MSRPITRVPPDYDCFDRESIPRLGVGLWDVEPTLALGAERASAAERLAALGAAFAGGIRYVDTPGTFGTGAAERLCRPLLAERPEVFVSSALAPASLARAGELGDAVSLARALERLLRALGRERLDLVLLPASFGSEGALEALARLREDGLVAAWGLALGAGGARWHRLAGRSAQPSSPVGFEALQLPLRELLLPDALPPAAAASGPLALARPSLPPELELGLGGGVPAEGAADERTLGQAERATIGRALALLAADGGGVAGGALRYLWSDDPRILPTVSCLSVAQVERHLEALERGALAPERYREVRAYFRGAPPAGPRPR